MKAILFSLALLLSLDCLAQAPTWVDGYMTSSGTYVQGHYRTTPNQTRNDNYSTRPNLNPFTGETGTKPRDEDILDKALRQQSFQTPAVSYPAYSTPVMPSAPAYNNYSTPMPTTAQPVYVGPRGGVYHYSPSGRKVYH